MYCVPGILPEYTLAAAPFALFEATIDGSLHRFFQSLSLPELTSILVDIVATASHKKRVLVGLNCQSNTSSV